jgi:hypothetical protein
MSQTEVMPQLNIGIVQEEMKKKIDEAFLQLKQNLRAVGIKIKQRDGFASAVATFIPALAELARGARGLKESFALAKKSLNQEDLEEALDQIIEEQVLPPIREEFRRYGQLWIETILEEAHGS